MEYRAKDGKLQIKQAGKWVNAPENLTVGGYLDLRGTGVTSLPENLTVGGSLDLRGTGVTSLPENLTVGGYLDLRGTGVTSLPENLTVGGSLDLEGTGVTSLPENLTVGGYLDLRGTGVTSLPENLTVGGYLDLRGTGVKQPAHRNIPTYPLSWRNGKYIQADGIFSEVVHRLGNVFKVKQIAKDKEGYLVTDGEGKWAHGETLKSAREDLIFKISDRDKSTYEGLGPDHIFTFKEAVEAYRVITGACAAGVKQFVEGRKRKAKYSVQDIVEITRGQYGHDEFARFFRAKPKEA